MRKTGVMFTLVAVLLLALAAGCARSGGTDTDTETGSGDKKGGESAAGSKPLVYAHHMPIQSLDIHNPQTYPSSNEANYLIYESLLTFDPDLNFKPLLAESYSVSPEGLAWTFKLKQGVKFHDGTPFNAAAVKANVERNIAGARYKSLWESVIKVDTPDEYTVVLTTGKPFAGMLNTIAHESGGMASPAAIQKHGDKFGLNPVGTGPYKVKSFNPGVELTLEANTEWWQGKAPMNEVVFRTVPEVGARVALLESGEADVVADLPPEEAQRLGDKYQILRKSGLRPFWIEFNNRVAPFDDVKVRQALNYAIDKEAIVKELFLGYATVADSPAAPAIAGYKKVGAYPYDPEKAKQLLTEAGYTLVNNQMVKNGKPLQFSINTAEGEYPKDIQVVEYVQSQLAKIGVRATIWKVEKSARWSYLRVAPKDAHYEAVMFGFNPSNGDIGYHLGALWRSNPSPDARPPVWNLMWYKNERVDQLLSTGDTAMDKTQRMAAYGEAQEIIFKEAPALWLYTPDLLVAARKDVKGAFVWPTLFVSLREATR